MQRRKLGELRKKAFEYNSMREFRHRVNHEQMLMITRVLQDHRVPLEVLYQMRTDLSVYNMYDALAMWLDDQDGLAQYCPDAMIQIGTALLTVKVYPVNWADRFAKTAGDIEFYLDDMLVKAAEIKDKPITVGDVRHCQMKAKRHEITEYIIVNGEGIVESDRVAIDEFIESQIEEGINFYLLDVPQQLFPYFLYLGEQGRKLLLIKIGDYLNDIRATRANKEEWRRLIDKYA